jgi:hypothetical protein
VIGFLVDLLQHLADAGAHLIPWASALQSGARARSPAKGPGCERRLPEPNLLARCHRGVHSVPLRSSPRSAQPTASAGRAPEPRPGHGGAGSPPACPSHRGPLRPRNATHARLSLCHSFQADNYSYHSATRDTRLPRLPIVTGGPPHLSAIHAVIAIHPYDPPPGYSSRYQSPRKRRAALPRYVGPVPFSRSPGIWRWGRRRVARTR